VYGLSTVSKNFRTPSLFLRGQSSRPYSGKYAQRFTWLVSCSTTIYQPHILNKRNTRRPQI